MMDKRAFRDAVKSASNAELRSAEKLMDAGARETQSRLSMVRRELKRRKRADAANLLIKDGWTP